MSSLTEDKLVQATTAEYFRDVLGWESVYAFNDELLGSDGTLEWLSENDVVLERYLRLRLSDSISSFMQPRSFVAVGTFRSRAGYSAHQPQRRRCNKRRLRH